MKKIIFVAFVVTMTFSVISCGEGKRGDGSSITSEMGDTPENSLDWNGVYSGVLPCADCEGIKTKIELNTDQTFVVESEYLGKDAAATQEKGSFSWNETGTIITLESEDGIPGKYKVTEVSLIQLDENGEEIEGVLAEHYVLPKAQ